jgi:cell division GTPase FtsZ
MRFMAKSPSSEPALRLWAIGLGQAGGNLAADWHARGYKAIAVNSARADLRALERSSRMHLDAKAQIYAGIEGSDGAGKDPEYGRACLLANADAIRDKVQKDLGDADALVIFAGLGGGTGSACGTLVEILAELEIPMMTVTTLPARGESGIVQVNAVKAVNALVAAELHGRLFIDNNRLDDAFKRLDPLSYYPEVNHAVLEFLDTFNRLNARDDLTAIRSFDAEDFRKVLLSGAIVQGNVGPVSVEGNLDAEALVQQVQDAINGGDFFSEGLSLKDVAYLSMVLMGPEKALKSTTMRDLNAAAEKLKEETGGGAVYEGLYVDESGKELMAFVLAASLALPDRVKELVDVARDDGTRLAEKIQEEIPSLELSALDGLQLFRVPGKVVARPTATTRPKPRPVTQQVLDEARGLSVLADSEMDLAVDRRPDIEVTMPRGKPISDSELESEIDSEASSELDSELDSEASSEIDSPRDDSDDEALFGDDTDRWDERAPAAGESVEGGPAPARNQESLEATHMIRESDVDGRVSALPPVSKDNTEVVAADSIPDLSAPPKKKIAKARPTGTARIRPEFSNIQSQLVEESTHQLVSLYEDLIDRFRQAPDRRGKERVARRLIEDARADDDEIRALAVWAMATLEEGGFRRALNRAAKDGNDEIVAIAQQGIQQLKKK